MRCAELGRRGRAGLVVIALLALPSLGAAPPQQHGHVTLVSQTAWVMPGDVFRLGLHVDGIRDRDTLEIALSTYARVPSRSAFQLTVQGRTSGSLIDVTSTPLTDLGLDDAGNLAATLPIQDPARVRDPSRLLLTHEGVYPVRVELREKGGGAVLDRFTTHLVYAAAAPTGPKLDAAWVLRVHAPPAVQPDGTRRVSNTRDVLTMGQVLEATPTVPVSVAPTPETVEALTTAPGDAAGDALASLRRALGRREVVTGPYVPASLPSLIAGGLEAEADAEVRRGSERLGEALHVPIEGTTYVTDEALDEASIARLRDLGVGRVALPESSMTPLQNRVTLARPFLVDAREGRRIEAASVDDGLARHFTNDGNQVLAAHQFLADLAVLYFDQPGGPARGVVALTPRSWRPNRAFLETALGGLAESPLVQPTNLSTIFENVDTLRGSRGPLVRRLVSPPRVSQATAAAKAARQRLVTFGSIVDPDNAVYELLQEQLLVAHSTDLRASRQRAYVSGVEQGVDHQLHRIQTPAGSITLTARGGQIPVTLRNSTGYPVHLVVTVRSDKLEFPGGEARDGSRLPNEVSRKLDLLRRNETARFSVLTRASGAFPIQVTLASPDGTLVVSKTRLTVRSTAVSGVGLVLSAAAGLFLLGWWGRHALNGRRARRLVPV